MLYYNESLLISMPFVIYIIISQSSAHAPAIEQMIAQHVLPDLTSPVGFLKARVCHTFTILIIYCTAAGLLLYRVFLITFRRAGLFLDFSSPALKSATLPYIIPSYNRSVPMNYR